jgi:hypothetical protein
MAADAPPNRHAFEGPAGCGKTHNLIEELEKRLTATPLLQSQRILALTYMNGARRRLDARLSSPPGLKGRCDVQTIDSFARSVMHARRSFARSMGLVLTRSDWNADCAAAARLLEQPGVAGWVANTYPIVVVDEFQDADPARLAMIRALGDACELFLAADEFQCLSAGLLPSRAVAWMREACALTPLEQNQRTSNPQLLRAAKLLRDGDNLTQARPLSIIVPKGPNAIAWCIANQLGCHEWQTAAIITPSANAQFSENSRSP